MKDKKMMKINTKAERTYPYVGILKDEKHTTIVYFVAESEGFCLSSTDEINTKVDGRYDYGWDEDAFVPVKCNMEIEEPKEPTPEENINAEAVKILDSTIAFIQADKFQVYDIKIEAEFDTVYQDSFAKVRVPTGFKVLTLLVKDK